MVIKVLLVLAAGALAVLILRGRARATHQALLRLAGLALVALAVVAVIYPDITVWAAHLVGVRRGTDLVLYVTVMAFLFVSVSFVQRLSVMQRHIVELTRELALLRAERERSASLTSLPTSRP